MAVLFEKATKWYLVSETMPSGGDCSEAKGLAENDLQSLGGVAGASEVGDDGNCTLGGETLAGKAVAFAGCPQLNESAADLDLVSASQGLRIDPEEADVDVEGNGCCAGAAATGAGAGAGCPKEKLLEEPCVEAGSPNPEKVDDLGVTVGWPKGAKDGVAGTGASEALLAGPAAIADSVEVPNGAKVL